jgi:uncharacterized membrane protein YeiH
MNQMRGFFVLFFVFNVLGLIAFMVSGALIAVKNKMDLGGVIFLSAVTGIGGGTIRDLLLQKPVFWMNDNQYFFLAALIGFIVFCLYQKMQKKIGNVFFEKLLMIFDTMGVIAFTISTVVVAKAHQISFLSTIILSVITCIGGSLIRDALCGQKPQAFQGYYTVSVAILSALYLCVLPVSRELGIFISCLFFPAIRFFVHSFQKKLS